MLIPHPGLGAARLGLLAAAACLAGVPSAEASTWRIRADRSGDKATIQAAIDAAAAGDTVLVAPGRYGESLTIHAADIVLRSEGGPEVTTLDGGQRPLSVVYFSGGETRACVLDGFTITGGRGTRYGGFDGLGGGIFLFKAGPTIRGNAIVGNVADWGGGIYLETATVGPPVYNPLIQSNVIHGNTGRINAGGIGFSGVVSGEIRDNTITGNFTSYDGGGIWVLSYASGVVIEGNTVDGNHAGDHGGGIYVASLVQVAMQARVERNVVSRNVAGGLAHVEGSGGGIFASWITGTIASNTIVANSGGGGANDAGGGLDIASGGDPHVERNIIALAAEGGGVHCEPGPTPTLRNNLAWGNQGGDGVGACPGWFDGDGNIQADPRFCGAAAGDYSLPADSPALTHATGVLGAIIAPGCSVGVPVKVMTWGGIKALYR